MISQKSKEISKHANCNEGGGVVPLDCTIVITHMK